MVGGMVWCSVSPFPSSLPSVPSTPGHPCHPGDRPPSPRLPSLLLLSLSSLPPLPAFCKWSSIWAGLLQMIMRMGRCFVVVVVVVIVVGVVAAACLLQMITRMGRPSANDHLNGLAFCFFSIFIFIFSNFFYFPPKNTIFSSFLLLFQILGSRINLADISWTICSC